MTNPPGGGWQPERDPYEPAPPKPAWPPVPSVPPVSPLPNPQFPNSGSRTNRIVIAVTAVVVLALVTVGVVVGTQHAKTADPTPSSAPSTVGSTGTPAIATTATTVPSSTPTGGISDKDQLCTDPMAQTDLIHLTVSLGFVTSYKGADAYEKGILDDCATPAVVAQLAPYFGKSFALPGEDLTGGGNSGATARYSVQLVNTSTYVSFTLDRRVGGGYQVVAVSGS